MRDRTTFVVLVVFTIAMAAQLAMLTRALRERPTLRGHINPDTICVSNRKDGCR